jgi:hypothetical protein
MISINASSIAISTAGHAVRRGHAVEAECDHVADAGIRVTGTLRRITKIPLA